MHAFPHIDPEEEQQRHEAALQPVIEAVLEVVNFRLPDEIHERFERIVEEIRARPPCVARLLPKEEGKTNWYLKFGNGVSWSLREGLGASHYHAENAAALEQQAVEAAAGGLDKLEAPDWASQKPIYTRKLNYEYQAWRFALRRTLDYLGFTVCAFWKKPCNSINGVRKALEDARDELERRDRVVAAVDRVRADLADIIGVESWSVRDQIAHWEALEAGTLDILWDKNLTGVSMARGAENLDPWVFSFDPPMPINYGAAIGFHRLVVVLRKEIRRVENAVFDVLRELGFPATTYPPDVRANERVRIAYSRGFAEIPWSSRQALLERIRPLESMRPVVAAFEAVGTSQPVRMTREQREVLLDVLETWYEQEGMDGLPEGVRELRDALQDDRADALSNWEG